MSFHLRTSFAAFALPLALLALFWQGGSCGKSGKAANTSVNGGVNANVAGSVGMNVNKSGDSAGGVARGVWGGDRVRLEVRDDGAEIEFDCAHGRMGKMTTDAAGKFNVSGVFVWERGGPVSSEDKEESQPARYTGRVEGKRMTLSVFLNDSDEETKHIIYSLTHGAEPNLTKCL